MRGCNRLHNRSGRNRLNRFNHGIETTLPECKPRISKLHRLGIDRVQADSHRVTADRSSRHSRDPPLDSCSRRDLVSNRNLLRRRRLGKFFVSFYVQCIGA